MNYTTHFRLRDLYHHVHVTRISCQLRFDAGSCFNIHCNGLEQALNLSHKVRDFNWTDRKGKHYLAFSCVIRMRVRDNCVIDINNVWKLLATIPWRLPTFLCKKIRILGCVSQMHEMNASTFYKGRNLLNLLKGIQRWLQFRLEDELEANNRTFSVCDQAFWISLDNLASIFLTSYKKQTRLDTCF